MSFAQNIARHVLGNRLYQSMRSESESWVMQCPCGAKTSVWEMGGIRWKASGQPRRMGRCGECERVFWGTVFRNEGANGHHGAMDQRPAVPIMLDETTAVLLWIDGVGSWMMFPGERVTIGGPVEPGSSQATADLCVLANLRRQQGTIERSGEAYRFTSADLAEELLLADGSDVPLGPDVNMGVRMPSVLSQTASLVPSGRPWPRMFAGRRTPASIDGLVLLEQVCLMGPGADAHVPCLDWPVTVILFRRNGQLWCRSQDPIQVDGTEHTEACALSDGAVVGGNGWRFRVERIAREGNA